jgi:hypothetical protein
VQQVRGEKARTSRNGKQQQPDAVANDAETREHHARSLPSATRPTVHPSTSQRHEQSPTKKSTRSVEQLLAQYPPAGTPAAAEAEGDQRGSSTRDGLPKDPPSRNTGSVAAAQADNSSESAATPLRCFASAGIRVRPTSQRPVFLTNDEMFLQYLRHSSTTSASRHRSVERSSQSPAEASPDHVSSSSSDVGRLLPSPGAATEQRPAARELGRSSSRHRRASHHTITASTSRAVGQRPGAVTFSSSSSCSSDSDSDSRSNNASARGQRPTSPQQVASSPPLIDARKLFKISPDRDGQEDPHSPPHASRQTRDDTSPDDVEAAKHVHLPTPSSPAHQQRPQRRQRTPLAPPTPLPPSIQTQLGHPSRRRLRAYGSKQSTRVSFATDSEEAKEKEEDEQQQQQRLVPSPARQEASPRRKATPPPPQQQALTPNSSAHRRKTLAKRQQCDDDDDAAVADRRSSGSDASRAVCDTGDAEGGLEAAWTVADMATNVSSHRLHHHSHEHLPHHKSPPAPSPLGTRRLHTAWASYLVQHGQPHLYGHDVAVEGRGSSLLTMPAGTVPQSTAAPAQSYEAVQRERGSLLVPASTSGVPAAAAALYTHVQECNKELLLLRASLLTTYTLLAAGGDSKMARRLLSSAPARRWEGEVGRYAGWTASTELREQQQQRGRNRDEDDDDAVDSAEVQESEDSGHAGSAARRGGSRRASPALSILRSATPWPALEARLTDSIRTVVKQLCTTAAAGSMGSKARRTSRDGRDESGGPSSALLPLPRLLLRESPSHDMKGLPSLWYPPHLSDAVGPVSGELSVWFSQGGSSAADDDDDNNNDGDLSEGEEGDESYFFGELSEAGDTQRPLRTRDESVNTSQPPPPPHQRSRSSLLSVFSRRSSNSGRRRSSQRVRSAPSQRSSRRNESSLSVSSVMKGRWRRCFAVADDHGVRVYPTACDYADYASERLLMAVPYASLAYLIPDFVEAAAALDSERYGGPSTGAALPTSSSRTFLSLAAVHACTVAAVCHHLCHRHDDAASYVYFGFVHRQTPAVEQHVASSAPAVAGVSLLRVLRPHDDPSPLHFAPWRVQDNDAADSAKRNRRRSTHRLHPPLVFRTQSRLAHAEWVHFFAYKFNRHLYQLLFPTACADMAEVGLRNAAAQTDMNGADAPLPQEEEGCVARALTHHEAESETDGEEQPHTRRRRSRHHSRSHSRHHHREDEEGAMVVADKERNGRSSSHRRRASMRRDNGNSDDDGDGSRHEGASLSNSPSRVSAPPTPPDTSLHFARALKHAAAESTAAAVKERTSLVQAIAQLRRTVEQRDQQLHSLEHEQAALTKALRQRERQVQDLQQDQIQLRAELQDALAYRQRQRGVEESQRDEIQRLRTVADTAVLQHTHYTNSTARSTLTEAMEDRRESDEVRQKIHDIEATHQRESAFLHDQLEELRRRYAADQAAWRAEQQALETHCRLTEVQVQNLRESASHQLRSLAHQVVRDLDGFHEEVAHGTEQCVNSLLSHYDRPQRRDNSNTSRLRQLQAPPALYADDEPDFNSDGGMAQRSPLRETAVVPATASPYSPTAAVTRAIASLLLTFHEHSGRLVDGELTVDEAEARLLYSGPTANQRGRRWELRHHDTDALLRIQLELLSRAPGDPHMSSHAQTVAVLQGQRSQSHSRAATRRSSSLSHSPIKDDQSWLSHARPPPPPPPPLLSPFSSRVSYTAAGHPRAAVYSQEHHHHHTDVHMPLSAVLRTVNASPRDTRASRLRQAAIERQIQEREELEDA